MITTCIIPCFKEVKDHEKIYKFIEPLENRFTSELVNLPDLLNEWEIIFYDKVYWFPLFYTWFVWEGKYEGISKEQQERFIKFYWWLDEDLNAYYCSTELAKNFPKLKKLTGMTDVRAYEWAYDSVRWDIDNDIDKIQRYINENYIKEYTKVDSINCIAAKKYPDFECLDFTWWSLSDLYIFQENILLTRLSVISNVLAIIIGNIILIWIIAGVLFLIYYKLIIYIIYWSYKKNS